MITNETARLIREADVKLMFDDGVPVIANLDKFAALVAAAEREAVAKLIEDAPELVPFAQNDQGGCMVCGFNPKSAASYIRARGKE